MILIIKEGNGDYAEDYYESIVEVYQINKKGLTGQMIEDAYNKKLVQLALNIGVAIHPTSPGMILHESHQPNGKYPGKDLQKQHRQILRENTFSDFVKQNYKAKQITDFYDVTI
jgi:hypothetical protein